MNEGFQIPNLEKQLVYKFILDEDREEEFWNEHPYSEELDRSVDDGPEESWEHVADVELYVPYRGDFVVEAIYVDSKTSKVIIEDNVNEGLFYVMEGTWKEIKKKLSQLNDV